MNRAHLSHPDVEVRRAAWRERFWNVRRSWPRWFADMAVTRRFP